MIDANSPVAGSQGVTWIGTAAFRGTGATSAGRLRCDVNAPDDDTIKGDADGDGTADVWINVISTFIPEAGSMFQ
ncbi:hypothetical protein [Roseomonas rosulenta]|uniref:hypothetical protein n=1 Tax=Roseomonas rosulenta TaxID=2748667 RepID=UPI0018DF4BA4|nr:hypothetical protein [Roseomonas rosulenta]